MSLGKKSFSKKSFQKNQLIITFCSGKFFDEEKITRGSLFGNYRIRALSSPVVKSNFDLNLIAKYLPFKFA